MFDQFVDRIEPGGFLVFCADDPGAAALARRSRLRRLVGYGRAEAAEVRLVFDPMTPDRTGVVLADGSRVPLRLTVPGEHMLLNAVAIAMPSTVRRIHPALTPAAAPPPLGSIDVTSRSRPDSRTSKPGSPPASAGVSRGESADDGSSAKCD